MSEMTYRFPWIHHADGDFVVNSRAADSRLITSMEKERLFPT